jgi:hypothetical protein
MKNWLLAKKRFDGCLFSLALLCTSTLVAAPVYKTTDEQGRVTYSDTPSSDQPATEAQLRPINQINTAVSPVKDGAVTTAIRHPLISLPPRHSCARLTKSTQQCRP